MPHQVAPAYTGHGEIDDVIDEVVDDPSPWCAPFPTASHWSPTSTSTASIRAGRAEHEDSLGIVEDVDVACGRPTLRHPAAGTGTMLSLARRCEEREARRGGMAVACAVVELRPAQVVPVIEIVDAGITGHEVRIGDDGAEQRPIGLQPVELERRRAPAARRPMAVWRSAP